MPFWGSIQFSSTIQWVLCSRFSCVLVLQNTGFEINCAQIFRIDMVALAAAVGPVAGVLVLVMIVDILLMRRLPLMATCTDDICCVALSSLLACPM